MVNYAAVETRDVEDKSDFEGFVFKLDINFILEILVKMNLEVFGAAGAVWGFSEVVQLRDADTIELWRTIAASVGVLFLARWSYYIYQHVTQKRLYIYTHEASTTANIKVQTRDPEVEAQVKFRGSVKAVVAAAKFKKSISKEARERRESVGSNGSNGSNEPRGGSNERRGSNVYQGNIDRRGITKIDPRSKAGCREAMNARTELGFCEPLLKNNAQKQKKAAVDGAAVEDDFEPDPFKLDVNFVLESLVKLNNEVFGAAGAVWGFSEIVLLRNEVTVDLWRNIAIVVGVIFFGRWCYYLYGHIGHQRLYIITHQASTTANIKAQTHVPVEVQFRGNVKAIVAAGKFKKTLSKHRARAASIASDGTGEPIIEEAQPLKAHSIEEGKQPLQTHSKEPQVPAATVVVENDHKFLAEAIRAPASPAASTSLDSAASSASGSSNQVTDQVTHQVTDQLQVVSDQVADQVGIEVFENLCDVAGSGPTFLAGSQCCDAKL